MGYRSDVHFVVHGPPEQMELVRAHVNMQTGQYVQDMLVAPFSEYRSQERITFHWRFPDSKWYESYEDVTFFEDFFRTIGALELPGVTGEFMRKGEEDGDLVDSHWGDEDHDWWVLRRVEYIETSFAGELVTPVTPTAVLT
jgi:hypothetical protein